MINKDKNNTVDVNELEVSYTLIRSNPNKKMGQIVPRKLFSKLSSSKGVIFEPSQLSFGK